MRLSGWGLAEYIATTYCNRNMTSTVSVVRKSVPVLDPDSGMLSSLDDHVVYTGIARVYSVSGPLTMQVGDEPQYFSATTVSIPERTDPWPQVDDVVTILTCPDDKVVGRSYRVTDVNVAGQFASALALSCTGVQPARNA
jgi:hypothetical protein